MTLFKKNLVGKVNPDLLRRLWVKLDYPDILETDTNYGFKVLSWKTPLGIVNCIGNQMVICKNE